MNNKALFGLIAMAVVMNVLGGWLMLSRPVEATHFRPAVCLNNHYVTWDLCYTTSNGDGLVLYNVYFNDRKVLHDMRIPHVQVYYPAFDIADNFSDNLVHNCWSDGFTNEFYVACNYKFGNYPQCGSYQYQEEFWFHKDGFIYPKLFIWGPGFDSGTHTYEALFRMDFDVADLSNQLYRWESGWALKTMEGKYSDDYNNTNGFKSGYEWVPWDPGSGKGYAIDPRDADGVDASEGAAFWTTAYSSSEIEGSGGRADIYVNGQGINDVDIVEWYTGQRSNPSCTVSLHLVGPDIMSPSVGY